VDRCGEQIDSLAHQAVALWWCHLPPPLLYLKLNYLYYNKAIIVFHPPSHCDP
jgi:hypothetical protein